MSVCLPACLSHRNKCAPLMHSTVSVPLFVFQCARSTMYVPHSHANVRVPLHALQCVPQLHAFHWARSTT